MADYFQTVMQTLQLFGLAALGAFAVLMLWQICREK